MPGGGCDGPWGSLCRLLADSFFPGKSEAVRMFPQRYTTVGGRLTSVLQETCWRVSVSLLIFLYWDFSYWCLIATVILDQMCQNNSLCIGEGIPGFPL